MCHPGRDSNRPIRLAYIWGIFNFFIVVPEIIAALFFGFIMVHFLHNNRIYAVVAGGVCMSIAALLMQRVEDPRTMSLMDL